MLVDRGGCAARRQAAFRAMSAAGVRAHAAVLWRGLA